MFILSLITNIIVMMGATSFFYWLESGTATPFVVRHREPLMLVASIAFMVYLFGQALTNSATGEVDTGAHWTYLNLLIITMYILNIQVATRWQVIVDGGLTLLYYLMFSAHLTILAILAWGVAMGSLWLVQRNNHWLVTHRWPKYGLFAVFAAAMLAMVYQMQTYHLDLWFWLRQLVALGVIGIFCLEFDQIMHGTKVRTDKIAMLANRDQLTGLLNFGTFQNTLALYFNRYQAGKVDAYSVFEFDLDWFKRVNDTYGHLAGNRVLHRLATVLALYADQIAYPATVYRLGGEEFAMLVAAPLSRDEAVELAENFQRRLREITFTDISPELHITCSIGEACVQESDYNDNDAYKAADRSLYHSKQNGRDRVTVAPDIR